MGAYKRLSANYVNRWKGGVWQMLPPGMRPRSSCVIYCIFSSNAVNAHIQCIQIYLEMELAYQCCLP